MLKDVRAFDIFYGMLQSLCLVCRFSTWGVQALGFVFGWLNGLRVIKVEARKLEHEYPHALKLKYKGS